MKHSAITDRMISEASHTRQYSHHLVRLWHLKSLHFQTPLHEETARWMLCMRWLHNKQAEAIKEYNISLKH
jgi:hypothetical protein